MTKKRIFILFAVVIVMALCVCSLIACNPTNGNGGKLEQNPISGDAINDTDPAPSVGIEYALTDDGTGYEVKGLGTLEVTDKKNTTVVIADVYGSEGNTLPVVGVAKNAFVNDMGRKIKKVIIKGNNMKYIGVGAFRGCVAMEDIILPNTVDTIEQTAFKWCEALQTFTFPSSIKTIGDGAFFGCSKFAEIVIPEGVESLSKQMFYNCSSLKNVTLPSSLKTIGEQAFANCSSLTDINHKPVEQDKKTVVSLELPDGIEEIAPRAFMDCGRIEKVKLPQSLEVIREKVFYGCSKLSHVILGDNVKEIGVNAFNFCRALVDVKFPDGLLEIKDYAFANTNALKEFKANFRLEKIGNYAFVASGVADVTITTGVKYIGKFSFAYCTKLNRITLPHTLEVIDEGAFMFAGVLPKDGEGETLENGRKIENFMYSGTVEEWNTRVKKFGPYLWGDAGTNFVIKCSGDEVVALKFDSLVQA